MEHHSAEGERSFNADRLGSLASWCAKLPFLFKEDAEYDIYSKDYESSWGNYKHALLHPLGFGMTYGIGVEYKKLMINVSGKNMGIIAEDEGPGDVKEHNFVLGASVSYRF